MKNAPGQKRCGKKKSAEIFVESTKDCDNKMTKALIQTAWLTRTTTAFQQKGDFEKLHAFFPQKQWCFRMFQDASIRLLILKVAKLYEKACGIQRISETNFFDRKKLEST